MRKSSPPPTAIAPVAVAPAAAQSPRNSAFAKLLADTGCTSKYSDDKKADLFCRQLPEQGNDRHRRNRPLRSDELSLKILPSTFMFDVTIKMCDAKATYDLEKGQRVTVKFVLTDAGGCILSYSGEQGIIIQ